ncbi:DUF3817 domain-containing protein [Rhodococcus sp. NPDC058514]|uniref:DUF3817 domain-containing protein n=1 Tax=unclassified Rhodococcus (in: high G+C Gram-positive bacteria) TaxID=192944 RepID=UPI00364866FD
MANFFDLSTTAKRFRFIAVIEAITWGLLLIGMFFKYVFDIEAATMVPGMLHGVAFIGFLILGLLAAIAFKWSPKVMIAAIVASIIPFATIAFERWVAKAGQLGELSAPGSVPTDAVLSPSKA